MILHQRVAHLFSELHVTLPKGDDLTVHSPIDGTTIASLRLDTLTTLDHKITRSAEAFRTWQNVPAPQRGALIRVFGEELRRHKEVLAELVTIECGKILVEARGEVQEMIDICEFAVGLSRQLYGLTIASERPQHTMQENWLPLGPVGVISAFNFPVAVWAWNAALALVCGDSMLWKPSEKTPLTAFACLAIFHQACQKYGEPVPEGLCDIVFGRADIGEAMVKDTRLPLISATGSTRMGRQVGPLVAARFGRSLLELGGNNAVIVSEKADLELALGSLVFGAVGTAGQRCTTTRRAIVHHTVYNRFYAQVKNAYESLRGKIGNPLEKNTLIGPLIDKASYDMMQQSIGTLGGVYGGQRMLEAEYPGGYYVTPALAMLDHQPESVMHETFAPILHVMPYHTLEEAVAMNNAVPQGLSASIFTTDLREAAYFKQYSDCGISNVNIGTSGAEIGGAFGGEKETGGGRESGSDSWRNYMRRQTSTTYHGTTRPALAQGIRFDV